MHRTWIFLLLLLVAPAARAAGGTCPTTAQYLQNALDAQLIPLTTLGTSVSSGGWGVTNCWYIDPSGGSDSNTGKTEASPFLHVPGGVNCTANCSAATSTAGTGFIIKGGTTIHAANLGIALPGAGNATNYNYIGVDTNWPSTSWARPIMDCGGALCSTGGNFLNTGNYVVIDNIEFTGLHETANSAGGSGSCGSVTPCTGTGTSPNYIFNGGTGGVLENCYFHLWSTDVTNNRPAGTGGPASITLTGAYIGRYNVVDGSDSFTTINGVPTGSMFFTHGSSPIMYGNYIRYANTGIDGPGDDWHDNLVEFIVNAYGGGHFDGLYQYGPALQNTVFMYNNVVRHNQAAPLCGAVKFWMSGNDQNTATGYAFNNVVYDQCPGNMIDTGGHFGVPYGTWYFFNNTVQCGYDTDMGGCVLGDAGNKQNGQYTGGSMSLYLSNNFWIQSGTTSPLSCVQATWTCPPEVTSTYLTLAQAQAAGYSDTGTFAWQATKSNAPTVGTGTNHATYCATISAANSTAGTACRNSTGYACTYNTSNHTVSCPAQTKLAHPVGAWDQSASQFNSGGGGNPALCFSPAPLAFNGVTIGSNVSLTETVTNCGNANLIFNSPSAGAPTGTNAADFSTTGNTCSGTVTPNGTCTLTVKFTPSVNGAETAAIVMSANAVGSFQLTGTGQAAASGTIIINPGPTSGSYVQACQAFLTNSGNTLSCTFANPQTLNNTNVCFPGWFSTNFVITSLTDTNSNNYGSALVSTSLSGLGQQYAYLASPVAAGANTITVKFSGSAPIPDLKCAEYQGALTLDQENGNSGSGTATSSGNVTTTRANDVLVGSDLSSNNTTAGTGYTQRYSTDGNILMDQLVTSTGTYSATSTQSPTGQWIMQLLALAAPTSLVFPGQNDGTTSSALTLTITNNSNTSVTLSTPYYTIGGTNAADFANAGTGTCANAGVLTAGQSCTVKVTITPGAPGARSATLTINSTATGTNVLSMSGTGIGTIPCATPTFSPVAGTYTTSQSVALSSTTTGATLCYTTDNSTPTANGAGTCTHGTTYSTAITVSSTETIKAIASHSGNSDSTVGSALYTITPGQAATPTFSPVAGTYTSPQTITISSTTGGVTLCYTTDGSTPTANGAGVCTHGTTYTTPVAVGVNLTLQAVASESGFTDSSAASAAYTINLPQLAAPTFSPTSPYTGPAVTVTITGPGGAHTCTTIDGTLPTTNGAGACTHGQLDVGTESITATTTIQSIATEMNFTDSTIATGSYSIPVPIPTAGIPGFAIVGGNPNISTTISIISSTASAYLCYTTDGTIPVSNDDGATCGHGTVLANGGQLTFTVTTVVQALASATGFTDSQVATAVVVINNQALPQPPSVSILLYHH